MPAAAERAPVEVRPRAIEDDAIVIDGVTRTMLTPRELAAMWNLPVRTIYRLIRTGRLPVLNLAPGSLGGKGDRYRISYRAVRELEASRDAPAPGADD